MSCEEYIEKQNIVQFTLSEIQRILYLSDEFRSPKEILRLHNSCFEHYVLLKEVFKLSNLSSGMTRDRLFGKYAHNLTVHAPIQYRLISGESINAEDEERVFNTLQKINKGKTNYRPGNLVGNMIVRLEFETINKNLYEFENHESPTLKNIRLLGENMGKNQYNSMFTYNYIQNKLTLNGPTLKRWRKNKIMKIQKKELKKNLSVSLRWCVHEVQHLK